MATGGWRIERISETDLISNEPGGPQCDNACGLFSTIPQHEAMLLIGFSENLDCRKSQRT
jgi:hypothetical protein